MKDEIQDYTKLQEQMHKALAAEHPEWIEADGDAPMLDLYDARFAELLTMIQSSTDRRAARQPFNRGDVPIPTRGMTPRARRIKKT